MVVVLLPKIWQVVAGYNKHHVLPCVLLDRQIFNEIFCGPHLCQDSIEDVHQEEEYEARRVEASGDCGTDW